MMREGPNLELAVRTESRPGEIETESVSDPIPDYCLDFVFLLSIYHSSIYIGGLPNEIAGYFEWIEELERDMTGQIDGLRIGGEEVSLWNFKTASLIQPSVEPRNKFLPRMTPTLRVDGAIVDGYGHRSFIKLNPEDFSLENEMENIIEFEFWTNSSYGLIFLAGHPEEGFLALFLRDNRVVFNFKLGSAGNIAEVQDSEELQSETWVHVRVER